MTEETQFNETDRSSNASPVGSVRSFGLLVVALLVLAGGGVYFVGAVLSADEEAAEAQVALMRGRLAQMAYARALYYDTTARNPKAALVAYRTYLHKFPFSTNADTARARVEALEESFVVVVPEGPKPQGE